MLGIWLENLMAYSLQIAIVAAGGASLLYVLRVQVPKLRLLCLQAVIAASLVLPVVEPWVPWKKTASSIQISTGPAIAADNARHSTSRPFSAAEAVLWILGAGLAIRLGMLSLGFWRIRRYRRNSTFSPGAFEELQRRLGIFADFRISNEVDGPVTFGLLHPVILIPEACLGNESIACHELVHVRRRDWLFTVAEECILSVFWFHPAMWWLIAQIQLAREQAVDREVVAILNSRAHYLESLLALAAARAGLDLIPASPFLRKRHLQKRVASLLKEVSMSKLRLSSSLAVFVAVIALAGWLGVKSFPLHAAPQEKIDAPGVTVQQGSLMLLHRAPVIYPKEAKSKRIQGTVVLEISISESGAVSDARVLSGPEELRKAALQSVLQWHYDSKVATKTQATVDFRLTEEPQPAAIKEVPSSPPPDGSVTLNRLILGVPEPLKQKIENRLPIHIGDPLTPAVIEQLSSTLADIDEHLKLGVRRAPNNKSATIAISLENASPVQAEGPTKIRVGGNVQAVNLIEKVTPVYPPLAKEARIQGLVRFTVTIGKDGKVQDVQLVSGHPLLVEAAQQAVSQWVYKPTLLNGNPVEIVTTVDVNFTLGDPPPAAGPGDARLERLLEELQTLRQATTSPQR